MCVKKVFKLNVFNEFYMILKFLIRIKTTLDFEICRIICRLLELTLITVLLAVQCE